MTVTVITVCAADRRHIYSSPKAIPPPFEPFEPLRPKGVSMPSRRPVFIADCLKCGMYRDSSPTAQNDCAGREGKHVTLSLYSSPARAIPPPSAAKRLSNVRTLRTFGAKGPVNPHAKGVSKGDTTTLSGQRPLSNLRTLRPFGAEPRQPSSLNPGRQGAFIIHHRHRALQRYCPEGCTHFPCRTLSARTSG